MNALKNAFIQFLLKLFHGFAHDISGALGLHTHVVTGGIYPLNIILVHPGGTSGIPYCET